jgi:hypothetical protein
MCSSSSDGMVKILRGGRIGSFVWKLSILRSKATIQPKHIEFRLNIDAIVSDCLSGHTFCAITNI